ncbi:thioredoxin family protein [Candidatus Nomurabacteria bacterium]|nr:thioredoxin family protein [Candidatus Nomurabacteria bacterium]
MRKKKHKETIQEVEIRLPSLLSAYLTPVAIIITTIIVCFAILLATRGSSLLIASADSNDSVAGALSYAGRGKALGDFETFTEYDNELCTEDGKPVVFMFSATWCPHCQWVGDTFNSWAKEQKDVVVYRYEVDTNENVLTGEKGIPEEHKKIYDEFNPNQTIPTFVFGCKYARVGNGYENENDLQKEVDTFNDVVSKIL